MPTGPRRPRFPTSPRATTPHSDASSRKNDRAYQSSWLLPEGTGDHARLDDSDAVFIGNSYGKSYHRLLARQPVHEGDRLHWRGVYTWFTSPIADDGELLCYEALAGEQRVLAIDCKRRCDRTVTLPGRSLRRLRTIDRHGDISIRRTGAHTLRIRCEGPASCILRTEVLHRIESENR